MTHPPADPPSRPLLAALSRLDDRLDALGERLRPRRAGHIAAYRGWGDADRVDLMGRVVADAPQGGPGENDSRWHNLRHSVQRFTTDEVRRQRLRVRIDGHDAVAETDDEGYYTATLPGMRAPDGLWGAATVSLDDGRLPTQQPVLHVRADAGIGVISDIDDTVLDSAITDWKTAAQLTFLHNARTRKPLVGAALLYQALQQGMDGRGRVPLFYVSSSPWNLYDLLEEFMALNGLPPGPMRLRDFGVDAGMFVKSPGHAHKLDRARELIERFPRLRWVLLGDSGQADAELYAEAAQTYGDRIAAIYIRDVDPDRDSPLDLGVDAQIARVAGTRVPMLRVRDSRAIADHAASIGLIRPEWLAPIEREVMRDARRPTLAQAATEAAVAGERGPDAPVG